MKKVSVVLIIVGLIVVGYCLFHFNAALNVVDSDAMTAAPNGEQTSEWPIFIGIILTFVGMVFYFASHETNETIDQRTLNQ